jgi:hypothetical protein
LPFRTLGEVLIGAAFLLLLQGLDKQVRLLNQARALH